MADHLPTADSTVLTQPIAAPTPDLAPVKDLLNQVGQAGVRAESQQQAEQGSAAVARDPQSGALTYTPKTEIFPWDKAYNDAAQAAYQAQSDGDQRVALQKFFADNPNDPVAAQTAAQGWLKGYVGSAPSPAKAWARDNGNALIGQLMFGSVRAKQTQDVQNNYTSLNTAYQTVENDYLAMAYQHGAHTPEAQALFQRLQNIAQQKKNPIFGQSPDKIDADLAETGSMAVAEAARGHIMNIAKTQGEDAALKAIDSTFYDPNVTPSLSMVQRDHYGNQARQDVHEWVADNNQQKTQDQQAITYQLDDALAKAKATGDWSGIVTPKSIMDAFPPARAHQIIETLDAGAQEFSMRKVVMNATPQQLQDMAAKFNPATNGAATAPAQVMSETDAQGHITSLFPGATITSGARTPEHNAAVGGVADSYHLSGQAMDFVLPKGTSFEDVKSKLAANGLPVTELLNEGDHVHWAWGTKQYSDWAAKQRAWQAFGQAVTQRQKMLTDDPAGYIAQARPDIAQARTQALQQNDPTAFQGTVRASLQSQRDLGVQAPTILSKTDAAGLVQRFNNAPDPAKRADVMSGVINSVYSLYGSYAPRVMTELQKAGLPSEAVALAQVRGDPAVSARMSNAINTGQEKLRGLVIDKAKDIDKALPGDLADFNATLIGNRDSSSIASQQIAAAKLYAYQLAFEGKSAGDAAQQAATDLLDKHYDYADTYRVPKGVGLGDVQAGAEYLQGTLKDGDVHPETTTDKTITQQEQGGFAGKVLRGRGVWATLHDDSGLRLLWPAETGYIPARNSKGQWIQYSWGALKSAAQKAHANSDPLAGTQYGAGD